MKKYLFLICFPIILTAQSNIKKLTDQLDLLSEASFNNWKYTTNLSIKAEELSSLNYDDSKWQNSQLDEHLMLDSCWFRKVIEVPEFIAGARVKGTIKFLTSVDDYGYMWINGESKGINSDVALTLQFLPKNIVESNFLEENGKTIKNDHDSIKFSIGKN